MLIARLIADPNSYSATLDGAIAALEAKGTRVALAELDDTNSPVLQISMAEGDPAVVSSVLDQHFSPSNLLLTNDTVRVPPSLA